jgi:hypothetical protein
MIEGDLYLVNAPHFYCAILMRNDRCIAAAPIVKWMVGKSRTDIVAYAQKKKWRVERIAKPSDSAGAASSGQTS